MGAKKFKVGNVQTKKDGVGTTIRLGSYSKNLKYATSVQLIVRDGAGNIVADVKDGYLQVIDPRTREGITEEQAAKIPDFVLKELYVTTVTQD